MRYSIVLVLVWIISLALTQVVEDDDGQEILNPEVRYLKRSSLSNMLRLGKRAGTLKRRVLCEDCNLGNLMRLGR
ncbi:hypothetical protein KIN20_008572 [Parelaphostrongylus tenuis]|uniref:Uncharacterized protein n=1 Tax=Parelaphostrongylus tenuis TaxID=148309 RepID=A0AAD5MWU5_PARTN|nr:hypothetical protein KIN20_008572 [Parelaphostrongylus tenuis]